MLNIITVIAIIISLLFFIIIIIIIIIYNKKHSRLKFLLQKNFWKKWGEVRHYGRVVIERQALRDWEVPLVSAVTGLTAQK